MNQSRKSGSRFWPGVAVGVILCAVSGLLTLVGISNFLATDAAQSSVYATSPLATDGADRVQMYFPLENFLTWRSTGTLHMNMTGNTVHVHLTARPFPALGLTVSVDILGQPYVTHGDFALRDVTGFIDHIALPKSFVLGAIAADGQHYGVHVSEARDSLFVVKSLGDYRLIGYDANTRDLILSLPVQSVERAARNQQII